LFCKNYIRKFRSVIIEVGLRNGSGNGNGVRKRQRLTGTAKRQRNNGNGMVETGHYDEKLLPLKFWNKHHDVYPNVSVLARIYLASHASFVLVEGLFSDSGLIKNARRSAIAPYRLKNCFSATTVAN